MHFFNEIKKKKKNSRRASQLKLKLLSIWGSGKNFKRPVYKAKTIRLVKQMIQNENTHEKTYELTHILQPFLI